MKRKLASIQIIDALTPIKKADRIELTKVLGQETMSEARGMGRLQFKVHNPKYLLKGKR